MKTLPIPTSIKKQVNVWGVDDFIGDNPVTRIVMSGQNIVIQDDFGRVIFLRQRKKD
jgi:hypothetical protein